VSRKNLKLGEETYHRLKDKKRDWETWDGFFQRAADELEDA